MLPSLNCTAEWNTELGFHHDLDVLLGDVEQVAGLDELEPLVGERGAVQRVLGAHRPVRMGEGLGRRRRAHLLDGGEAEGAAARRQHDRRHLLGASGQQALEDRAVLRIHRDHRHLVFGGELQQRRSAADDRFLVGEGDPAAGLDRGDDRREPGRAGYGGEGDIGAAGGKLDHAVAAVEHIEAGAMRPQARRGVGIAHRHPLAPEFLRDRRRLLPLALDGDAAKGECVPMEPDVV
jgi:hypothetical protein